MGATEGVEGNYGQLILTDANGVLRHRDSGGPTYSLSFQPSGQRLFHVLGNPYSWRVGLWFGCLRILDPQRGTVRNQVDQRFTCWRCIDDHRALACVDGVLQVWDLDTLRPVQTLDVGGPCHTFELSDDGRTLVWHDQREVFVYRVVTGP